jgi:hypothetical protein
MKLLLSVLIPLGLAAQPYARPIPPPTGPMMLNGPFKSSIDWTNAHVTVVPSIARLNTPVNPYTGNSYEFVEPHIYYNPAGWNGYKFWLYACPYDGSNAAHENGSLFVSNDGLNYATAPGVVNPVATIAPSGSGNNADGGLADGFDGNLYMYYENENIAGSPLTTKIYVQQSPDGLNWSAARDIGITINQSVLRESSPWIFFDGTQWHVYTVAGSIYHRTAPSIYGPWSAGTNVIDSATSPAGKIWYHLDGMYFGGRVYLLLFAPDTGQTLVNGDLYLAWADDFATFTEANNVSAPAIAGTRGTGEAQYMYKSSIFPIFDGYQLKIGCICGSWGAPSTWELIYQELTPNQVSTAQFAAALANDGTMRFTIGCNSVTPGVMCDNFRRANSASSLGTSSAGNYAWTNVLGTCGISASQLYLPAATNTLCTISTSYGNGRLLYHLATWATDQNWLIFRVQDANNYYRAGYTPSGSLFAIQKVVASVVTTLASVAGFPQQGDWIQVTFNGSTFNLYDNGQLVLTSTGDTTFTSSLLQHGIQTNSATIRLDGFAMLTQ